MDVHQVTIEMPAVAVPGAAGDPLTRGRRRGLARLGALALAAIALAIFIAAMPAVYERGAHPPDAVRASLAGHDVSIPTYATWMTALQVVLGVSCFAAAVLIARRRADGLALFVATFLMLLGAANPPNVSALADAHSGLGWVVSLIHWLMGAALLLFFFLFPTGRIVPRRAGLPLAAVILALLAVALQPGRSPAEPSDVEGMLWIVGLGGGVISQVHRYRKVSTLAQRQQTKWVVLGGALTVVLQFGFVLAAPVLPSLVPDDLRATAWDATSVTGVTIAYLLIPLTIGIAILRHHLWDIDVVISRTLLYGALTTTVIATYVLVVGGASALLQTRERLPISLVATGLIALGFQPLRDRLQRAIDRFIHGERDQPYAVLARLGRRLEETIAPETVAPTIVRTVREALRLPYVAITRDDAGAATTLAAAGNPPPDHAALLHLPLAYQGTAVGELLLAPRAPGEGFTAADRRLLHDLARQAGIAVHAVRLTADLQRSRERLVTAREEERRRLRRDLHDGLGPQMAGFTLRLDTVGRLLGSDPAAAGAVVLDLKESSQALVADIRRLVYDLRPPALDELGLVGALRHQAVTYGADGLAVTVEDPRPLPPLPAAVEVAAWRIAQESLVNVVRHAKARTVTIRVVVDEPAGALGLAITDDGQGLPLTPRAGVGLASMRERAAELGGTCRVESAPEGGTRVLVRLPLAIGGVPGEPS